MQQWAELMKPFCKPQQANCTCSPLQVSVKNPNTPIPSCTWNDPVGPVVLLKWSTWWNTSKRMSSGKTPLTFFCEGYFISNTFLLMSSFFFSVRCSVSRCAYKSTTCCGSELHYAVLTESRRNWWCFLVFGFETSRGESTFMVGCLLLISPLVLIHFIFYFRAENNRLSSVLVRVFQMVLLRWACLRSIRLIKTFLLAFYAT